MSKLITTEDIRSRKSYEDFRTHNLQRIRHEIQTRQIPLGTNLILHFINLEIVLFQLHELFRAERISESQEIEKYIQIYNHLIPAQNQLSGLLFPEFQSKEEIQTVLHDFQNISKSGTLQLELETADAVIEGTIENSTTYTSPQCAFKVIFEFTDNQVNTLAAEGERIAIILQQKKYNESVKLRTQTVQALQHDLNIEL